MKLSLKIARGGGVMNAALGIAGVLGLIAAAAGEAYLRLQSFEGELCVAQGGAERVAVRIADTRSQISNFRSQISDFRSWIEDREFQKEMAIQRGLRPGEIPFENRDAGAVLLDNRMKYDAVRLPFAVQLKKIAVLEECPAECRLKQVSERGQGDANREIGVPGQQETGLAVGAEVLIGEERFKVEAIRKWSGLLRDPNGAPMAAVSLGVGDGRWTENVFLVDGTWRRVEPSTGLCFHWFESEDEARKALDAGPPGIESARWGVADGDAVNWFESFAPGTGSRLADGTSITLLQLDENHAAETGTQPAIEVQIQEGGNESAAWIAANQPDAGNRVRFDYPARLDNVVLLYGYPGGTALVAAYGRQHPIASKALQTGETWAVEGLPFGLRLDQALDRAVSVGSEDSPLYEAVLVSPTSQLRLRQGETIRYAETQLEFIRSRVPPAVRYDLALAADNGPARTFSVSPGKTVPFGAWGLSQAPPAPDPTRIAVLHVELVPNRTWLKLILAASLAALVWSVLHSHREGTAPPGTPIS